MAQDVAGLGPRLQVHRARIDGYQPAEIHDTADPRLRCGGREVFRRLDVQVGKITPGGHRVHEVERDVDILHGRRQRLRVKGIGLDQFHASPVAGFEHGPVARCRPHVPAGLDKSRRKIGPDVATGTENQRPDLCRHNGPFPASVRIVGRSHGRGKSVDPDVESHDSGRCPRALTLKEDSLRIAP